MHIKQPSPHLGTQLTLLCAQTHLETLPSTQLGAWTGPYLAVPPPAPALALTDFKVSSESRGVLRAPAPFAPFFSCVSAPEPR